MKPYCDESGGWTHVYPTGDYRDHDTEGPSCWCHPLLIEEDQLVIHNALDQRERMEVRGTHDG